MFKGMRPQVSAISFESGWYQMQENDGDGRHIHQKMDVVNQDQHDRKQGGEQNKPDRSRRQQQENDRKQAAIDVEMAERVHEILEEKRRGHHEHEQRQLFFVEDESTFKQVNEQAQRDEPYRTRQREHQPNRHLGRKQRDHRTDQCALGEAELIVDQKMGVGNVGRQADLVQENPNDNQRVDDEHQPPGVLQRPQIHQAPLNASPASQAGTPHHQFILS
jgi:hypothetical protein